VTEGFHLAQLNIGRTYHPLDDPRMSGFVDRLADINALAESSPGYVWRLQGESGDATGFKVSEDPQVIVNLTVWETADQLYAFTYRTEHIEVLRGRHAWFEQWPGPHLVLWWIPAGSIPSIEEALARLDHLAADGPGPGAFTFKVRFPPPAADVAASR
jgi:heme-degrading monooxygenase HmoA